MTEYMEQLQWDAVDEARQTIATGSAAEKSRVLGMVLGKQVALSARRTPRSGAQLPRGCVGPAGRDAALGWTQEGSRALQVRGKVGQWNRIGRSPQVVG